MHLQGGVKLPVVQRRVVPGPHGRVRRADRPLRRRQVVDPEDDLRQLPLRPRPDRGASATEGAVTDLARAEPRQILSVRRHSIGYVSQFLRAVPRVPTLDVVAEPLIVGGMARDAAREQATELLRRLNIPERLWALPPSTFSGGEQQRVNIARGFISDLPILLLDEPTASLDAVNRAVVVDLIGKKKRAGVAMVAIVHDDEIRHLIADRVVDVTSFAAAA